MGDFIVDLNDHSVYAKESSRTKGCSGQSIPQPRDEKAPLVLHSLAVESGPKPWEEKSSQAQTTAG